MYRVRSLVPWFDLCALPYFLCSSPGPFRVGILGRLVLVGSGCTSRRRPVSRILAYPGRRRGVRVKSSALSRPFGRRVHPEAARDRSVPSSKKDGPESENGRSSSSARPSGRWLDRPSGLLFRYLGRPMSCVLFATLPAGPSLCWEAGPRGTPDLWTRHHEKCFYNIQLMCYETIEIFWNRWSKIVMFGLGQLKWHVNKNRGSIMKIWLLCGGIRCTRF